MIMPAEWGYAGSRDCGKPAYLLHIPRILSRQPTDRRCWLPRWRAILPRARPSMSENRKSIIPRALDPTFILAGLCTFGFYYVIYQPSMRGSILQRYTSEHVVEHVIVALFIWGIIDIFRNFLAFPRELLALRHAWLPPRQGAKAPPQPPHFWISCAAKSRWLQESKIGRRLVRALEFVSEKGPPTNTANTCSTSPKRMKTIRTPTTR